MVKYLENIKDFKSLPSVFLKMLFYYVISACTADKTRPLTTVSIVELESQLSFIQLCESQMEL